MRAADTYIRDWRHWESVHRLPDTPLTGKRTDITKWYAMHSNHNHGTYTQKITNVEGGKQSAYFAHSISWYFLGRPRVKWRRLKNSKSSTIQKEPKSSSNLTKHLCKERLVRIAFCAAARNGRKKKTNKQECKTTLVSSNTNTSHSWSVSLHLKADHSCYHGLDVQLFFIAASGLCLAAWLLSQFYITYTHKSILLTKILNHYNHLPTSRCIYLNKNAEHY